MPKPADPLPDGGSVTNLWRSVRALRGWRLHGLLMASLALNAGFIFLQVATTSRTAQPETPMAGTEQSPISGDKAATTGNAVNGVLSDRSLVEHLRAAGCPEPTIRKVASGVALQNYLEQRQAIVDRLGQAGDSRPDAVAAEMAQLEALDRTLPPVIARLFTGPNALGATTDAGLRNSAGARPPAGMPPTTENANATPSERAGNAAPEPTAPTTGELAPAPNGAPAHETAQIRPQRSLWTPEQQLYRSLYGWQNFNDEVTKAALDSTPSPQP